MPTALQRVIVGIAIILHGQLAVAQDHRHDVPATVARSVSNVSLHMEMTPVRRASAEDSVRAANIAKSLKAALAQFRDTASAVAAGYIMFMPQVKDQKTYHFTNRWRAVQEAFRFETSKPTSLLYRKESDGRLVLVGAMYTAPKRFGPDKLDARIPLSIARWHKHVNWCIPKRGDGARWLERRDGQAVFGPESPIATQEACDAVQGNFHDTVFGWMVHANVFAGEDPAAIWGDEHAGHDMHAGMKAAGGPRE